MTQRRCWKCGALYDNTKLGYCSIECENADEQDLAEGNRIVAEAQKNESLFKPLDSIRLDTQGPIGTALKGLHIPSVIQPKAATTLNDSNMNDYNQAEIVNEYDKDGNL